MHPFKRIFLLSFVFILMGCLANLGDRDNVLDPNGVYNMYEKGYPWVEFNYDDLDRMKVVVRYRTQAKFYYVLMPDGAAAPTKEAVKSGAVAGKLASGSIVIAQNAITNETNVVIMGVNSNSAYSLYCVSTYNDAVDIGPTHIRVNHRYLGWYGWDGAAAIWHPAPTAAFGASGNADGRFNQPRHIACDWAGYVYVCDYNNHRIQKFSTNFTLAGFWGRGNLTSGWHTAPTGETAAGSGSGDYQFNAPNQIAIDRSRRVMYITDYNNHRVQKYDLNNNQLLGWWGKDNMGDIGWHNPGSGRTGASGASDGMFNGPHGVAVDDNGIVYVADYNNQRVQVFRSDGAASVFIGKIGLTGQAQTLPNLFNYPRAIASDGTSIYVAESGAHRVQKLSILNWQYEWQWSGWGSALGLFDLPISVSFDRHYHLYTADYNNHRVQKFSVTGRLLWVAGRVPKASANTDAAYNIVGGVGVDEAGAVYIADLNNHRIQKYW